MQKLHLALTKLCARHAHSTPYSCRVRGDLQIQFFACSSVLPTSLCIQTREHLRVAYNGSVIFRQFCLPSLCICAIAAVFESWPEQLFLER